MRRVFRIWHGDRKKKGQQQWHFVPNHQDYSFTMYMDSPETLEVIDATMLFPSGPSPLVTIATTSDLVSLMSRRPPSTEITLLVTFGAKKVAEFQFLSCSDYTIGSSTYVVGDAQDERARARYECLVLGERLLTSERVMNEIFGEQEMLILHRVALEMEFADRVRRPRTSTGVVQRVKIIQLDDDDEMPDTSQMSVTGTRNFEAPGGAIIPLQPQPLAQIPPAVAPSVLWDVGLDLLDYPEFYNAQRDGRLVTADSAFWNELSAENSQSMDGIFLLPTNNDTDISLSQEETMVGVGFVSETGNKYRLALNDTVEETSTGYTAVICSQLGAQKEPSELVGEVTGGGVVVHAGTTKEKVNNLPGPTLTLSLACGSEEPGTQTSHPANLDNTSSEGSDTEGGF
ncbi:hypothetical protein Bca4012_065274 [Brassica carinata]